MMRKRIYTWVRTNRTIYCASMQSGDLCCTVPNFGTFSIIFDNLLLLLKIQYMLYVNCVYRVSD